jgi:hypothetical protein
MKNKIKVSTTVTFTPQAWVGDETVTADAEGPTEFKVPASELAGIEPDTIEADNILQRHKNAPKWIQFWSGPFVFDWDVERILFDTWVNLYGKRYFRSYEWDGVTFIAIGRTGITHNYDRTYMMRLYGVVFP